MENKLAHNLDSNRTDDVRLKDVAPFSNWLLKSGVKKGLQEAGFRMPTVIQASAIPVGKTGLDLLIQSKAGTGKTLIFCTILLENCLEVPGLSSLIVAPTREIAIQIENVLRRIARQCKNFQIVCAIGGTDMIPLRKQLQTANAVVGTPGRLVHLIESDMLKTNDVKLVVLDEADQLYGESHRKNLETILNAVPVERQILACSATFCNDLDMELAKVMRNPLLISTKDKLAILIGIKQFVYKIPDKKPSVLEMEAKIEALLDIFKRIPFKLCMVFVCSQSRAETYTSYLKKAEWQCEFISGALPQSKRNEIFQKFCNFETRILVSTDLMARGIDSENANLVINLEPPRDMVTYLHRIGRAGRFGSFGIAVNILCTDKENTQFEQIMSEIGSGLKLHRFPKASDDDGKIDNFWEPSSFKEELTQDDDKPNILRSNENETETENKNNNDNIKINKTNDELIVNKDVKIVCSTDDSQLSVINTDTFCVDSKDSAVNVLHSPLPPENKENLLLLCQPEDTPTSNRSSVQLSANTIDDASSIAPDSQFSVHQELLAPCPSLAIDIQTKCTISEIKDVNELSSDVGGGNPQTDFFLDYDTNVLKTEADVSDKQELNLNNTLNTEEYSQPESIEKTKKDDDDVDVFADYIKHGQTEEEELNEEATCSHVPESNESTTVGEDFSNEKQDTSMEVCANSIVPTEIETYEKVQTEEKTECGDESNSDERLTDSQTNLDQTLGFTTNGSCDADSEPSMDMINAKEDKHQQKLTSAYNFEDALSKKNNTIDAAIVQSEKNENCSLQVCSDDAEEDVQYERKEETKNFKINELWMNEYRKQVNFIQSYTKFMLDYSKNCNTE